MMAQILVSSLKIALDTKGSLDCEFGAVRNESHRGVLFAVNGQRGRLFEQISPRRSLRGVLHNVQMSLGDH